MKVFYSRARRKNRRIASYVTVFATPLLDKNSQSESRKFDRGKYSHFRLAQKIPVELIYRHDKRLYCHSFCHPWSQIEKA